MEEEIDSSGLLQINRPRPIVEEMEMISCDKNMHPEEAVDFLADGKNVLIEDYFGTGLQVLKELSVRLKYKFDGSTFQGQREYREVYREYSNHLFLIIDKNKLRVKKSPEIGWLQTLYPDVENFILSFPQVQGLNSSWQWHENGVNIPMLRNKIKPFYGVYFPNRFEHLQLFDNWLKRYEGAKKTAIDVGIGCGVLALQMTKYGFQKVYGTDTNPNAIVGMQMYMEGTKLARKIDLAHGSLFADNKKKTELIVFNPPWLPATQDLDQLDEAIYYPKDLFSNFFEEAVNHLTKDGRLVMLFSNLAKITGVTETHPIEEELATGGRFKKSLLLHKKVKLASKDTKRNQNWREEEVVELWVLELIDKE